MPGAETGRQNLSTGVGKLNGTILMPGESLSVCDATAPYDAEHGYVEAGSYENGQVVGFLRRRDLPGFDHFIQCGPVCGAAGG